MNPHFFTAPFYFAFIWFMVQGSRFMVQGSRFKVQGSGFKVQGSKGSKKVQRVQKRFKGFKGGGVAHFVILSGEKGRV